MQKELWKPFPSLPYILVSSHGKIYDKDKARYVNESIRDDGQHIVYVGGRSVGVHRIVWETFSGPLEKRQRLTFIDGDPGNPSYENLQIESRAKAGLYL